jgi:hypothetical protein
MLRLTALWLSSRLWKCYHVARAKSNDGNEMKQNERSWLNERMEGYSEKKRAVITCVRELTEPAKDNIVSSP